MFVTLMTSKYSHYLASKAFYYAPEPSQKAFIRSAVQNQIQKLILHTYAAEVIEYIYCQSTDAEKREMVFGLYGNYYLLLKEFVNTSKDQQCSLAEFIEKKPNLGPGLLEKLEPVVLKLVHKGLTRHSICQAIINDYIQCQPDKEKLLFLADLMKEKLPALLASTEGLGVACGVFNILDAKDRKVALKTLPVAEMAVNRVAHLYLVHVANTLDDTQLTKKKLLHECLKQIDDLIADKSYQTVLISSLLPMPTEDKD
jgi:hypothetical protein